MSDAELIKALVKARMACKAVIRKEGRNQAQGYAYVGHEHVLTSGAREALLTNGLVLVESGVHYVGEMHYATKNGQQTCWRWKGEFLLLHEAGGVLKFEFEATTGTNDKTGFVASTALDRTALLRICQLAGSAHEDPEHDSNERYEDTAKRTQRVAKTLDEIASGGDAAAKPVQPARGGEPRPLAHASVDSGSAKSVGTTLPATDAAGSEPAQTAKAAETGEILDAQAWKHRYEVVCEAAEQFAKIHFSERDDLGLLVPPFPCPRFNVKAKQFGGRLYTEVPTGFVRKLVSDERFSEQSTQVQTWAMYICARRAVEKDMEGASGE